MAQIDLKYAHIRFKDGYTGPTGIGSGQVNHSGGYAAGATVMAVDTFTGIVTLNDWFTVVGDVDARGNLVHHIILGHAETSSVTTSLTFSPPLSFAVADNAAIVFLPHELEVIVGEGTLTYDETKNREYKLNRGLIYTVRDGDQAPVDISLDFVWEFLKGNSTDIPTVEDVLKNSGQGAGWITSSSDPCEPYALDIEIEYIPLCAGQAREIITLADFRYEKLNHNIKEGTVSVTGKCNVQQAAIVRAT